MRYFLLFILLLAFTYCSGPKQATAMNALTVMSYNIHHANPPSKPNFIDIDAIAAVINQQKPDIVALQEVDVNTGRSGINEAVILAEKTKMNFYFAKAIDHDGGDYGVAILSRHTLSNGTTHKLPTLAGTNGEPRVLATANITVNGKQLTIACTHLDAQRSDTNRVLQINAIMDILKNEKNPVIIAGDFNATPGSAVINTLDKFFIRTCLQNCSFTIPQVTPTKEIDFIAFKPGSAFTGQSHQVIDEKYASDHLPVVAVLRVN
jgi:endonuclease/exonuclease/phosphatase family metal-dependent hydrolase